MELSPAREPNLEGGRRSEIIQISVFFGDLFQNLKKDALDIVFCSCSAKSGPKGVPKGSQNPLKVE